MGNFIPQKQHATLIGPHETDHHIKRRGFSRAIGAEQADDFTRLHVDGNAVHHPSLAVFFGQIFRFQQTHFLGGPNRRTGGSGTISLGDGLTGAEPPGFASSVCFAPRFPVNRS